MFPMISEVAEFDQAKAIVERELTYLRQHGHALPERIDVGTMVEVPALLYQMDELLKKVDFVSVGRTICSSSCSRSTAATPRSPNGSTPCRRRSCARCARS
jgi:Signal transduction protein containing GAF and PtsI domains